MLKFNTKTRRHTGKKYFANRIYTYVTCCMHARGEDIEKMVDNAIDVTYRTFIKRVPLQVLNEMFGYGRGQGLHLIDDWHVSYHRSRYRGRKCYFIKHSGIEYIFC